MGNQTRSSIFPRAAKVTRSILISSTTVVAIVGALVTALTTGCFDNPNAPPEATDIFTSPVAGTNLGPAPVNFFLDAEFMTADNLAEGLLDPIPLICYTTNGSVPGVTIIDDELYFCFGSNTKALGNYATVSCDGEVGDDILRTLTLKYFWDAKNGDGPVEQIVSADFYIDCAAPVAGEVLFATSGGSGNFKNESGGFPNISGNTTILSGWAKLIPNAVDGEGGLVADTATLHISQTIESLAPGLTKMAMSTDMDFLGNWDPITGTFSYSEGNGQSQTLSCTNYPISPLPLNPCDDIDTETMYDVTLIDPTTFDFDADPDSYDQVYEIILDTSGGAESGYTIYAALDSGSSVGIVYTVTDVVFCRHGMPCPAAP